MHIKLVSATWHRHGIVVRSTSVVLVVKYSTSDVSCVLVVPQDFFQPHLKMFRDPAFGERGGNVDLTVPLISMEETGFGLRTQSIDVIGGV